MVEVGQAAPDFTLKSHQGTEVSLSQFKGDKVVVLSWHVLSFTGG
jgi:peroxiredoxin